MRWVSVGTIWPSLCWGANENWEPRFTLGDQSDWGPMRTLYSGLHWETNEMGVNEIRVEKVTLGHQ